MPRRRPAELHVNHERWLVSYADFITLLFAFFVVMYSISQVNESKYRVLSDTLIEAFEPVRNVSPIQVGELSRSPSASAIDIRGNDRGDTREPELGEPAGVGDPSGSGDPGELEELGQLGELGELGERISEHFADLIGDDLVTVQANEYWLQIELRDSILFASGSAELSAQAQQIFTEMAGLLVDYDNPVQIEGHTDNQPINNIRYPSNWELSTARASAIVKLLIQADVSPSRLSAVGYGEYQPSASNASAEGRAENRRVTLMIAREAVQRPSASLDDVNPGSLPPRNPPPREPSDRDRTDADTLESFQVQGETADTLGRDLRDESGGEEVQPAGSQIQPVKLESGGLLFSSDPDLPRQP